VRDDENTMLGDTAPSDLSRRIKRDNRLWLLTFLAVLAVSAFLVWALGKQDEDVKRKHSATSATQRRTPFPGQQQYRASDAIREQLAEIGIRAAWVRFVDRDEVEIELPATVDRDIAPRVREIARQVTLQYVEREPIVSVYVADSPGVGKRAELPLR